jgi:hypothetical protein
MTTMPSLSLIETEARRIIGHPPEAQRRAMQAELVELCESHWQQLRGPEPETPLAQALWSITPPLADLFLDAYARGETEFAEILPGGKLAHSLALLVLAEIERGNEEGVHIAHEPMMAFEEIAPPPPWLDRIAALLRGTLAPLQLHHHKHQPPLWKALAIIAAQIRRTDLPAVWQVIRLLTTASEQADTACDEVLSALNDAVHPTGIHFLRIDDDHLFFEQHGHEHKPARARQLADMLLEIRQMWLG